MHKIITIGRQFGTDGSEIGKKLSLLTGIPCYDKEYLISVAEKEGIARETFEKADEQATSSFLYSLAMSGYNGNIANYGMNNHIITDKIFNFQSKEIKKLADEGDCIIIGRCADDVLSSYDGVLKIFLHAPIDHRVEVLKKYSQESDAQIKKQIVKTDKKRATYYNFYTGKSWGDQQNYHFNIDCSLFGVDGTASIIKTIIEEFYK